MSGCLAAIALLGIRAAPQEERLTLANERVRIEIDAADGRWLSLFADGIPGNLIAPGDAPSLDVRIAGQGVIARHGARVLRHETAAVAGQEGKALRLLLESGEYEIACEYILYAGKGRLERRARVVRRGTGDAVRMEGFLFLVPGACVADPEACVVDVPGPFFPKTYVAPGTPYAALVQRSIDFHSAPDAGFGLLAVTNANLRTTLASWMDTAGEVAYGSSIRGDGKRIALRHFEERGYRLRPGEIVQSAAHRIEVAEGGLTAALAAYRAMVESRMPLDPRTPAWAREMVLLEVFPDYFPEGFRGIARKLPFYREIGFDAIYLMPHWKGGYSPIDLYEVEPRYGTADDLKALVRTAHGLGMRVLFDMVIHGFHENSPLTKERPELFVRQENGALARHRTWKSISTDWASPAYQEYMVRLVLHDLEAYDIDGYRVDAATYKGPSWDPTLPYPAYRSGSAAPELMRRILDAMRSRKPDCVLLSEVFGPVFHSVSNLGHDNQTEAPQRFLEMMEEGLVTAADYKAHMANVLPALGIETVDRILFTHHHRDQACGAAAFGGARLIVPEGERALFDAVESFWEDPKSRWHIYSLRPSQLVLPRSLKVDGTIRGGDLIAWGSARIRAIDTPGHTDGSLSYLVEVDGMRVVFSGDAIYDAGRLWDIHSLQKGTQTTDYHGFLGAAPLLRESLERILAEKPEILVPSHGRPIRDPSAAIAALRERLDAAYESYVAISALRYYFPELFAAYADRTDHLAIRPGKEPPPFLRHVGTSWIIIGEERAAFVADCGSPRAIEALKAWLADGTIRSVEGLWVTHYHDDHVDAIPEFQRTFDCPCYADRSVAQVIANPLAWRLPCISPARVRVDRATEDGESWTWRGFRLTAVHLPGQTLYHGGLLVEGQGCRVLLAGDSFTPAGIDDYCAHNRNWLGAGVGLDRAVARVEELAPTHILNCHVDVAWDFPPEVSRFLRANLAAREALFGALLPWDHPNYGLDASWVRCFPYEQEAAAGAEVAIEVIVTNHSPGIRVASARAVPPWGEPTQWRTAEIPPKREGAIPIRFRVPAGTPAGRIVIPLDLVHGEMDLPRFAEAILAVRR